MAISITEQSIAAKRTERSRLLLLDIFKVSSMIAIVLFHFNEFIFDSNYYPLAEKTYLWRLFQSFAEVTAFSGQSIVALFSFLYGLRAKVRTKKDFIRFLTLATVGYLVVALAYYDTNAFKSFYWDIYAFLGVAYATLFLILSLAPRRQKGFAYSFAIIGLIMLILPFESRAQVEGLHTFFREALLGLCNNQFQSSWPLFPWIGLVWFFFGLGYYLENHPKHLAKLQRISSKELVIDLSLLVFSCYQFKYFRHLPYGDSLYCYIQTAPHLVSLSYLLFILLIIRFAFVNKLNDFIASSSWLSRLTHSAWARYFALSYILHIAILGIAGNFQTQLAASPILFDLTLGFIFVAVELFGFGLTQIRRREIDLQA